MPIDRNGGQYITANPQQPTQSSAPGIWDMDEQGSAQASGRWPLPPNVVQRSLRFNSADSAYLTRSVGSGNRQIFTWSSWIKTGKVYTSTEYFFSARQAASDNFGLAFQNNSVLQVDGAVGGSGFQLTTTQVFRDPSAWYHILMSVDTTLGSNRIKLYVNGTQITAFSTETYPAQNALLAINLSTATHNISGYNSSSNFFNGYMAEVNFIDGQALTPSSFGQTDAQTGQWIPRVYSGSYGTNGFRLQFLDNSGTTATTLGKDTSGMGNNWTPSGSPGFSVAAGSGNDSLRDVPMNYYSIDNGLGGEVIGNYCTFNPLAKGSSQTLANGNLDVSGNLIYGQTKSTIFVNSGKWYFEYTLGTYQGDTAMGLANSSAALTTFSGEDTNSVGYLADGRFFYNSASTAYSSYTAGDVIGIAFDCATGKIWIAKNNIWQNSGNPVAGTGQVQTVAWADFTPIARTVASGTISANFGQRPFAYTAPSGFKALCTQNLPWSGTITTSGTFTGNASTDGPFVYLNGIPTAMTINGNAVTFGTQADKLSNGFKVRSSSASYNTSGSNTYSVSTTGNQFSKANAQANP